MRIDTVCAYCGSSPGRRPDYVDAARRLGLALADRGIGLVYGGARVGLMGVVADAVLGAGGTAVGVIPEALVAKEVAHTGLTELVVTASMHERKTAMADRSDAFVALPGGIGTLKELFEVWTWGLLGFHAEPCGLLDVAGYFDGLVRFLDPAVSEAFVKGPHRSMLAVESEPDVLLDRFATYAPPVVEKWATKDPTPSSQP